MLDKWKQTFPREQSTHVWDILIQDYIWLVRFADSKPMRYDFLLNYIEIGWRKMIYDETGLPSIWILLLVATGK